MLSHLVWSKVIQLSGFYWNIKNFNSFVGRNPIHIQLENDPTGSQRYVDITLTKQIVISGLSIQTVENMALQSFSFSYAQRNMEFPGVMTTFTRLLNDKQVS